MWGGGVPRKNPFHRGGMDVFWNYTMPISMILPKCHKGNASSLFGISRGECVWGGGVPRKNPFHRGGMDVFWNYTMPISMILPKCHKGDFGSHNLFKRIKRVISV